MFRIGLIINPFAGIGGRVGLKGSDGSFIQKKALEMGAPKLAELKASTALEHLLGVRSAFEVITVSGEMGESLCDQLRLNYRVVYNAKTPSTGLDTQQAVKRIVDIGVDLIVFAGGDGTARDIFEVCDENQLVLGIPAGVKIHSGVYAISPESAGILTKKLIQGELLSLLRADVVDIDEAAFRRGTVKAKKYGHLSVPAALEYVQAVKSGGVEVEALVLDDIAAEVIESMEDSYYYVIGSGTTCAVIMQQLGLDNTLLGSDVIHKGALVKADAIESDLIDLLNQGKKLKFIITVIGGQGHILGRGNHQLSPRVIAMAGWDNFEIVATKSKLAALAGRPLRVDTGNSSLDHSLWGSKKIITGYRDYVVYPVGIE